jgi:glutaminyl-tRNA synthetase
MGVMNPLKVVIENLPEDHNDVLDVVNNPENPSAGCRKVPFSREFYIEREDFMEAPPKNFFRMAPGREVRLRNAYLVTCTGVEKSADGQITGIRCAVDSATRGGDAPDGRKVKSTLHWVSARHAIDAEVRVYDRLFTVENPAGQGGTDFRVFVNPDSLKVVSAKVEPTVASLSVTSRFQFERLGYFCVDKDTTPGKIILNKTIGLRDAWAKEQGKR